MGAINISINNNIQAELKNNTLIFKKIIFPFTQYPFLKTIKSAVLLLTHS